MEEHLLTAIYRATEKAIIGAIKTTGDKAKAIRETTGDLLKVTIEGATDITLAIEKKVGEIIAGAIGAATEVGEDYFINRGRINRGRA